MGQMSSYLVSVFLKSVELRMRGCYFSKSLEAKETRFFARAKIWD